MTDLLRDVALVVFTLGPIALVVGHRIREGS